MAFGLTGFLNSPDLHGVFGLVCGQNPEHTWMPAGILLPCCQRCLGLYVGAALAFVFHILLRPKLTARFLEWHGAFLLLMLPLGFHWVPQGPVLRTVSGLLFGAGVVTFLWLTMAGRFQSGPGARAGGHRDYAIGVVFGAVLLPLLAAQGGPIAAVVLMLAATAGLLSISALAIANLLLGSRGAARWLTQLLRRCANSPTGP